MSTPSFYSTHVDWYPLLDPREDHEEECEEFVGLLLACLPPGRPRLLELGGGAGNNATYLKTAFAVTVTDLSAQMLDLSKAANPECRHIVGDMRTMRLEETFDAVLLHDAVSYLTTVEDLRAALTTVFVHLRPGGVGLVIPDCVAESFVETADTDSNTDGERALDYLVRVWDPDPTDTSIQSDYLCLLRDADGVTPLHIRSVEGCFPVAVWRALLSEVGFEVEDVPRGLPDDAEGGPYWNRCWRVRRP